MKLTIKVKMIGAVTAILVFSIIAVSWYSIHKSGQEIETESMERMGFEVARYAAQMHATSEKTEGRVISIARLIEQTFDVNKGQDQEYLQAYGKEFKPFIRSIIKEDKSLAFSYMVFDPNVASIGNNTFKMDFSRPEGKVIESTPYDRSMFNPDAADMGWFYDPIKNDKLGWVDPYLWEENGVAQELMTCAMPVKINGKVLGVAGMDTTLDNFSQIFEEIQIYDSGFVFMINGNHKFIVHNDKELKNKLMKDSKNEIYQEVSEDLNKADAFQGKEFFVKNYHDELIVAAYKLNNGGYLVAQAPVNEVLAGINKVIMPIVLISIICIVIAFVIAFVLVQKITAPVIRMREFLQELSKGAGDLTQRVEVNTSDEVGEMANYFNKFIETLASIISDISSSSSSVASSATEIAATTEELSSTSQETSMQSNGVASAVEEMTASIMQIAQNAEQSNEQVVELEKKGQDSIHIVTENVNRISDMNKVTEQTMKMIETLKESTNKISEVVTFIGDIADQTNLLALNAAIEAARAGEHGRGFAVVADEVRKLAEKTANSVQEVESINKEVSSNIGMTIQDVSRVNQLVGDSVEEFEKIRNVASETVDISNRISDLSGGIYTSTNEQTTVADEISNNISGIAHASEEMNRALSQTAVATNDLSAQSEKLNEIINKFKY